MADLTVPTLFEEHRTQRRKITPEDIPQELLDAWSDGVSPWQMVLEEIPEQSIREGITEVLNAVFFPPCPHGVPTYGYFVHAQAAPGHVLVRCGCCGRPGARVADDTDPPMSCPLCGVVAEVVSDA